MRHSQGPYRKPVPRRKYTSPRAREKEERMHRRRQRTGRGPLCLRYCDLPNAERNYQLSALSQEPKSTNRIESAIRQGRGRPAVHVDDIRRPVVRDG